MIPWDQEAMLTVVAIGVLFILAVLHIWMFYGFTPHRRRLTKLARLLPGPVPISLLGDTPLYLGNPENLITKLMHITDKYPPPMRQWLGPTLLVFVDDPRDIEVIMTHPKSQKKDKLYKLLEPYLGKGLITSSGEYWRRHKKIISPTFHASVLDTFVDSFVECSNILSEKLKTEVGRPTFDVIQYTYPCSLDMVCETIMGCKMNTQNGDNSDYHHAIQTLYRVTYIRVFKAWLHSEWIFSLTSLGKELYKALEIALNFSSEVIKQKKKEFNERKKEINENKFFDEGQKHRKVFVDLMLELTDSEMVLTDHELREESDTLISAAVDTVSTISAFTFLMLGMHQDCQMKLCEELDNIFGDSDLPPTSSDLQKMVYLDMVLKETIRLFPIGPTIVRELEDDIKLRDYVLPAGCSVVMFLYRTQRSPKNFKDPDKFNPDRFLPENMKHHPYSFLPFSGGPRKCIGKQYAMMALKVLVSTVVRKYKIFAEMKLEDLKVKGEISIHAVGGYNIRLENREEL